MNVYENIVIFNAALSEEALEAANKKVKDLIIAGGGEILKTDLWGRRKLGYEINKHKQGHFILYLFRSPSTAVRPLEDLYKIFEPVIKYMIIKLEKKQREAAVAAVNKENAAREAAAAAPKPVVEAEVKAVEAEAKPAESVQ